MKIEVIDHDDFVLQFEQSSVYKRTLVESDEIYENFMAVKARDNDCTNDGYACSYEIITDEINSILGEKQTTFKVDNLGMLSSTRALKNGEVFDFKVRAFDCLNKESFADALVHVEIIEKCYPQWTGRHLQFLPILFS